MWFESQNCAMMGVQVTAGKRKLETAATAGGDIHPAKAPRWEPEAPGAVGAGPGPDNCIARLQAVAVPGDAWRPTTHPAASTTGPVLGATPLTATLLSADDFDDDDDFEDELSDDDRGAPYPPYDYHPPHQAPQQQQQQQRYGGWQYYAPPAQQTIRCEENGKSYLELGAAPVPAPPMGARARCCDGRTRWCNVPCYRQRRLAVLNLSMCKLARYRQCSDPSLRRSVLICNTLRHIEREMETEGQQNHSPPQQPEQCYSFPPAPLTPVAQPLPRGPPPQTALDPYEHSLREFASPSGRATPHPASVPADTDSGIGISDDDAGRSINWGSVLSLTSQTDLEPLNNNELYAELGLEWKEPGTARVDGEWDTFMHVLVGGS